MSNRVIIDQTTNTVSTDQCPEIHNSVVVNNDVPSTIEVTENVTNIVTVAVPGPQGPAGPQGPIGLGGDITGSQYYAAIYKSATGLFTGSLYQSESFTSIRNATSPEDPANPDILYVNGEGVDTYNLISAHSNRNGYVQVNVKNYNNSTEASSDIVATADNGTESENYIDMGINSSGFTNTGNVGGQNDAYVYSTGNDLYIGNASAGKQIIIFNGGLDAANQAKVWIHDQGTVGINTDTYNASNPPSLQVNAPNANTYNIAQFFGNTDSFAQVGIANANGGTSASADLALYNNIDYEGQLAGFVDLGINSTNYVYNGVYPGSAGDAYLFTDSEHLVIGSVSGSGAAKITLFAGGISEFDNAKLVLYGNNKHEITGSLKATEGFSGSLFGTASWALNSLTASYAPNAVSSSYPIAVTGSTLYSFDAGTPSGPSTDNSIFFGQESGYSASSADRSIFLGYRAGYSASTANYSNFFGSRAGAEATNAYYSNFFGEYAGYSASQAFSSNFIGNQAGYVATNAYYSNFFGQYSGFYASDANKSNFFGKNAGYNASYADNSNFFGESSGESATNAYYSNFFGQYSGFYASNANNSNFIGNSTGQDAINANLSNFIGYYAGISAISASNSIFIGTYTGRSAIFASHSILLGYRAGESQPGGTNSIRSNNIIIGNNITLPKDAKDSINLGAIIFATGSYSNLGNPLVANPFSGSANGRVGINQPNPVFGLDVSGSGRYTNGLTVSSSLIAPSITGSLQGTASWALNALTASFGGNFTASNALINGTITAQTLVVQTITSSTDFVTGSTRFGSLLTNTHQFTGSVSVTGSLTVVGRTTINDLTGSLFGTSSWALNSLTASYVSSSNVVGTVTSASYALTASYALNAGVAGAAFPFTGSAQITGSLGVTGSVAITGSLNVGSSNIEYQENTNVTTGTWRVVSSEPTASYRAAFFDYVMFSGSVARAGTVYSVWSASYAEYYENYTGDVGGSTSGVTLQAAISGSNIQLQATSSNNSWTIRSLVRML